MDKDLKDWCINYRALMQRNVEMMRSGILREGQRNSGGAMEDTTNAALAECERRITEFDGLLATIEARHS